MNKKPAGSFSNTVKHSHQELSLEKQNTIITNQEDKLAELRYALDTLAGGENHAALNQLKKTIDEFEITIEKLRQSVIKQGGTPPPRREYKCGKPLMKTTDHANEADRKRQIQKREFKNRRRQHER